jgi:hypothetical protein
MRCVVALTYTIWIELVVIFERSLFRSVKIRFRWQAYVKHNLGCIHMAMLSPNIICIPGCIRHTRYLMWQKWPSHSSLAVQSYPSITYDIRGKQWIVVHFGVPCCSSVNILDNSLIFHKIHVFILKGLVKCQAILMQFPFFLLVSEANYWSERSACASATKWPLN